MSPTIDQIRSALAEELNKPPTYRFFWLDYLPDEEPDAAILRLFEANRKDTFEATIKALCWGP